MKADSNITNSDRPAKRQRRSEIEYHKLQAGYIRILQVTCEPKRSGLHHLSMQLRSFSVQRLPHFLALSYAWPNSREPTRTVRCNDSYITVSRHVYYALENLCPTNSTASFAIWIDAICINQADDSEKSNQVPHMGSIYSLASQVIVWLGPNELVNAHLQQIEHLAHHVKDVPESGWDWVLLNPPFPKQDQPFWKAMNSMVWSRWFQRLWIVQELCLGREVNVLCGRCFVPWRSLAAILRWEHRLRNTDWDATDDFREHHALGLGLNDCRETFRTYLDHDGTRPVDITDLLLTLKGLRSQACSKPIDKVFGLLFLLPKAIRQKIVVDYSLESEYWRTYVGLARALVTQIRGLCILAYAPFTERATDLPTWCPDWNVLPTGFPCPLSFTLERDGFVEPSLAIPQVRFGDYVRHLHIQGFRLDRIAYTNSRRRPEDDRSMEHINIWLEWQSSALKALESWPRPSADSSRLIETHLRNLTMNTWTPDWGPEVPKRSIIATDYPFMEKCYQAFLSHCEGIIAGEEPLLDMGGGDEYGLFPMGDYAIRFHSSMYDTIGQPESFSYFITEKGRVGRGSVMETVGDVLVLLNTVPVPYILRYDGKDPSVAKLVGEAYLDGCMDVGAISVDERSPDEWFVIG
jgi:hypothetical protein